MNTPDEAPKLTPWPFLAADIVLLAAAYFVASQHAGPLTGTPLVVAGSLVFAGAVLAVVPFVLNHTRRQELALDERQREIAALAQTTSASAEQLSIAVASLHGIAESASRAAKLAEQLPARMQERVHEFKEQINEVSMTENEALSQEVNTLRAAETERIESVLTTVRKLSSEFARLEAASRKNVTELTDVLAHFTAAAQKAAGETSSAAAAFQSSAQAALANAQEASTRAIEHSLRRALAELESKLAGIAGQLEARLQPASEPRKAKPAAVAPADHAALGPPPQIDAPSARTAPIDPSPAPADQEPPPASHRAAAAETRVAPAVQTVPEEPKPARRRASKRAEEDSEPLLGLDLPPVHPDEFSQAAPEDDTSATAVSADGFTRLLVTSYIGIGNKLYVRGEGPGLSWEKGTPLQFVSIGKWRWETSDAAAPVRAKLFKNDEIECPSLGEIVIDPAHQKEVRANFH